MDETAVEKSNSGVNSNQPLSDVNNPDVFDTAFLDSKIVMSSDSVRAPNLCYSVSQIFIIKNNNYIQNLYYI